MNSSSFCASLFRKPFGNASAIDLNVFMCLNILQLFCFTFSLYAPSQNIIKMAKKDVIVELEFQEARTL